MDRACFGFLVVVYFSDGRLPSQSYSNRETARDLAELPERCLFHVDCIAHVNFPSLVNTLMIC